MGFYSVEADIATLRMTRESSICPRSNEPAIRKSSLFNLYLFLLRCRNYYVSMGGAAIPPRQAGQMVRAGCAATTCAPAPRSFTSKASRSRHHRGASPTHPASPVTSHCDFLIDSTAIRNARNSPENNIITFSNRSKIVCWRAHFTLLASLFSAWLSQLAEFLIATRILEIGLTHSQQKRKHFLIATFSALFNGFAQITEPRSSVFALRVALRFQQEDVVAFGVVKERPGWATRSALRFVAEYALASQSFHRGGEFANLEKHDSLIGRRIIFRAFALETQEDIAGGELRMVAAGFVGEREAENIAVEFFRARKLVKVQLDAHHAGLCSFGHGLPPAAILRRYGALWSLRAGRCRQDREVRHKWLGLNCSGGRASSDSASEKLVRA